MVFLGRVYKEMTHTPCYMGKMPMLLLEIPNECATRPLLDSLCAFVAKNVFQFPSKNVRYFSPLIIRRRYTASSTAW